MLIRCDARELRDVFRDVKPIYKGTQEGALMGFTLDNHILYITCNSGVVSEHQIASEHPGPYSLTVLYQDLSEILPGRGFIELELSPLFVGIKGESMTSVLPQANGLVSRYAMRCTSYAKITPEVIKTWAQLFSETAPVAKTLQREAPIIFKPPYAIMKYNTFWLQLANNEIDTVMDLKELKAVAAFAPTEFGIAADVIEFKRGAAILALQRNSVDTCKYIEDMTADHCAPHVLAGGAYLLKVQQFLRSVGPGACRCHFYATGIELVVNRPGVQSSLKIGRCEQPITSISTALEYVQMFFRLCGESPVVITTGASSLFLQTPTWSLLMSIT